MSEILDALTERLLGEQLVGQAQAYGVSRSDVVAFYRKRGFLAGSGRLVLSVAGNVRALITNPADSGKRVFVAELGLFATATGWAEVRRNPTSGLPAGSRSPLNLADPNSDEPPVAVVAVDTDATTPLGGGTATSVTVGIPPNERLELKVGFELAPGQSLGFNVPFAGAADAAMSVRWKVVDA
jgi:hypothetical protein